MVGKSLQWGHGTGQGLRDTGVLDRPRARSRRRALDAARRPGRALRRAALQRLPGPPRHPARRPGRPAAGADRRGHPRKAPLPAVAAPGRVRRHRARHRPVAHPALAGQLGSRAVRRGPAALLPARRVRHRDRAVRRMRPVRNHRAGRGRCHGAGPRTRSGPGGPGQPRPAEAQAAAGTAGDRTGMTEQA
ncbi:hypothetical protein SGPA1_30162 [Streptomyces misionensis JCM 4497]